MVGRLNSPMAILIIALMMIPGCFGLVPGKQAYVVFLDFTESAATFVGENPAKIKRMLHEIAAEMEPEDLLEVYPIHAYTESATPLLRLNGPPLQGDLRDRQRLKHWKETEAARALSRIWDMDFGKDRTSSTNIYPTVRKISRLMKAGYRVKAYLVCDMIQDFRGEDFSTVFREGSDVDPVALAQKKVAELGFEDVLDGVEVIVMIPGSPQGNQTYDRIRPYVNAFWEEFFARCGADVVIRDL